MKFLCWVLGHIDGFWCMRPDAMAAQFDARFPRRVRGSNMMGHATVKCGRCQEPMYVYYPSIYGFIEATQGLPWHNKPLVWSKETWDKKLPDMVWFVDRWEKVSDSPVYNRIFIKTTEGEKEVIPPKDVNLLGGTNGQPPTLG